MRPKIIAFILMLALLTGCGAVTPSPTVTAPPPTAIPPIATAKPLPTQVPTVKPTEPPPTPTYMQPFETHTTIDLVNVRSGPGSLFNVITMVQTAAVNFKVLGRSPGTEWIRIQLEDETTGWISAGFVFSETDLVELPVIVPDNAVQVTGRVLDAAGLPVDGIEFTVLQGRESGTVSTFTRTDKDGIFYAFLPPESYGKWYVTYRQILCESSLMDEACQCQGEVCGKPSPEIANLILPQEQPLEYEFVR